MDMYGHMHRQMHNIVHEITRAVCSLTVFSKDRYILSMLFISYTSRHEYTTSQMVVHTSEQMLNPPLGFKGQLHHETVNMYKQFPVSNQYQFRHGEPSWLATCHLKDACIYVHTLLHAQCQGANA